MKLTDFSVLDPPIWGSKNQSLIAKLIPSVIDSMHTKRSCYLDQIKAVIVALVIALHAPMAFGGMGWIGVRIPVEGAVGPVFGGFFA